MNAQIHQTIVRLAAEKLMLPTTDIRSDAALSEYGLDSLDAVELLIELEHVFQIDIPDEDAEQLTTIDATTAYIAEQVQGGVGELVLATRPNSGRVHHAR